MNEKTTRCIEWIREFFQITHGKTAVLGISGGKDSTVVAALCAEALGKENVLGVLMPNGVQPDISDSEALVAHLGIRHIVVNLHDAFLSLLCQVANVSKPEDAPADARINLAPRLRMATVYATAQTQDAGRVANTGNRCEAAVGYTTLYGDLAGDFAPILNCTVSEVRAMGHDLGIPRYLVEKAPSDGLSGKTDEDRLGFTYAQVEDFLAQRPLPEDVLAKITAKHRASQFKRDILRIPAFPNK
ncbi:MAG: NAD(+) synthase [Victivallales bacterium]|nr:NAD(+) synthase [Victivallales bacterium]